ncbi:MAG TPA: NYN domain-containing protein, partial [Candidatus Limnocylindrales bacterium]|nr:NYN domain-containing protein [Candidatus Limnocylindrales bacterium]
MKVFIDGENLRHRLVSALYHERRIHDRDDMIKVDVRKLITEALGETPSEIIYYTTKIRQPDFEIPHKLQHKIELIQESHRRWIADLTNQGIKVIKAGTLKVHESRTCYECGKRTMLLHEKGVDVRVAIDIVQSALASPDEHIVVMSSDSDLIPAIEVARRVGTKISYLCGAGEENETVALTTDNTYTYTHEQIIDCFKGI